MRLSPQRMIFPLLVSISLTGAGVVLIHFLNKKKSEDEEQKRNKKITHKSSEVELKIARQSVPIIIGRGGEMIRSIQDDTGTTIKFKKEDDIDASEVTCIIIGTADNIALAEKRIKSCLENPPIIETYETYIPVHTLFRLMDQGGKALNQIQSSSNTKIIFDTSLVPATMLNDPDSKQRIIIKGTAKQIADALVQIEDKVREENDTRAKTESSTLIRVPRVKTSPVPTTDNKLKNVDYSKEIFGNQGKEGLMDIFVCAVENPNQFYIQVIGPANASLDDLVKQMTEYYEIEENKELHTLKTITAGQMVAAKFSVDNKWYRAEVIADLGDQKYDVYFVDFGDRENVDGQNIFELRTDFLSLRLQAIECSLAGVKPCEGEWSNEATEAFATMTSTANWQPRVAKIRGYKERTFGCGPSRREGSPIPCVELYDKREDKMVNIGEELVRLELACPESEPWSAASSNLSLSRRSNDYSNDNSHDYSIQDLEKAATLEFPKGIESIDLGLPVSGDKNSSRNFIENERSSPPAKRNGLFNGNNKPRSRPANPFGRPKAEPVRHYNIVPAGYESSEGSDEFEIN